eukprot:2588818-Rhodomonas_salina.1
MCGTETAYGAMVWCYALCGTEIAYAAMAVEEFETTQNPHNCGIGAYPPTTTENPHYWSIGYPPTVSPTPLLFLRTPNPCTAHYHLIHVQYQYTYWSAPGEDRTVIPRSAVLSVDRVVLGVGILVPARGCRMLVHFVRGMGTVVLKMGMLVPAVMERIPGEDRYRLSPETCT